MYYSNNWLIVYSSMEHQQFAVFSIKRRRTTFYRSLLAAKHTFGRENDELPFEPQDPYECFHLLVHCALPLMVYLILCYAQFNGWCEDQFPLTVGCIHGVTLLALGNGAPDVFSAMSAVRNMKNNDVGLLFGALLGMFSIVDARPHGLSVTNAVIRLVCAPLVSSLSLQSCQQRLANKLASHPTVCV